MNLELTEDQEFFRETTRRFLDSEAPLTSVRALWDTTDGLERDWWSKAAELGWTTLFVPEAYGGGSLSGHPVQDAVIVAEEMGRIAAPGPFLPVNVVCAALARDGSDQLQGELFPGLLAGETIATWAFAERGGTWDSSGVSLTAAPDGDAVVLTGEKAYVEAAGVADHFLVTARTGDGLTQVIVPAGAEGVTVTRGRSIDLVRRFGSIAFDGVACPRPQLSATLVAPPPRWSTSSRSRSRCSAPKLSARPTASSSSPSSTHRIGTRSAGRSPRSRRSSTGLPTCSCGSSSRSRSVDAAARAVDGEGHEDPARLVSVAKAYVADRCLDLIDDCVQINGGIGVTWEHDIHIYSRRVAVNRAVFGSPEEHRERICALLEV